jgi:hypothetical protein
MSATDQLALLIKSAEAAMRNGDIDTAEGLVNRVMRKQAAADAEDEYDDPSNPSLDASDDGDNPEDDPEDDDEGIYEDDEDDEEDPAVIKAEAFVHDHKNMTASVRPRASARARGYTSQSDTYQTGVTPTVGEPKRHKFDARVEYVQDRDGCSKTEAMSRARQEFPETYRTYQDDLARQRTSAQRIVRGQHFLGKRRSTTYEDLVSAEIRKGCNMEVASQRVAQQHGFGAMRNRMFAKGAENVVSRFQKRVDQIAYEDNCGLDEATRKARIENPRLFRAMQSV